MTLTPVENWIEKPALTLFTMIQSTPTIHAPGGTLAMTSLSDSQKLVITGVVPFNTWTTLQSKGFGKVAMMSINPVIGFAFIVRLLAAAVPMNPPWVAR